MSSFLASSGQDPSLFCERFNGLLSVLVDDEGRRQAEEELRLRGVGYFMTCHSTCITSASIPR